MLSFLLRLLMQTKENKLIVPLASCSSCCWRLASSVSTRRWRWCSCWRETLHSAASDLTTVQPSAIFSMYWHNTRHMMLQHTQTIPVPVWSACCCCCQNEPLKMVPKWGTADAQMPRRDERFHQVLTVTIPEYVWDVNGVPNSIPVRHDIKHMLSRYQYTQHVVLVVTTWQSGKHLLTVTLLKFRSGYQRDMGKGADTSKRWEILPCCHCPGTLWLRRGGFTCVGWQVTPCDPIWQVMLHNSVKSLI